MSRAIVQLVVVLSFLSTPLVTEAQQPGQPARRGIIYGAKPDFTPESNVVEQSFVGRTGRATATSWRRGEA